MLPSKINTAERRTTRSSVDSSSSMSSLISAAQGLRMDDQDSEVAEASRLLLQTSISQPVPSISDHLATFDQLNTPAFVGTDPFSGSPMIVHEYTIPSHFKDSNCDGAGSSQGACYLPDINLNTERSQSLESLDVLSSSKRKVKTLHKESNLISIMRRLPRHVEDLTTDLTVSWKSKTISKRLKSPRKQRSPKKQPISASSTVSCPFCFEDFNDKTEFMAHYRNHTGKDAFTCPNCPKTFAFRSELKRHIKSHSRGLLQTLK